MPRFRAQAIAGLAAIGAGLLAACSGIGVPVTGSPENGRRLTEKWCVQCHAVAGARRPTAPSFADIAAKAGRDDKYLRGFLEDDHFPMTMHRLFENEKEDILAYLKGLRRASPAAAR
jgi:mono/diheme cytochrome c family protein